MERAKIKFEDVVLISFFVGFFLFCIRHAHLGEKLGDRIILIAIALYLLSLAAVFFSCAVGWIKRYQIHIWNHKITYYFFYPLTIAVVIKFFS